MSNSHRGPNRPPFYSRHKIATGLVGGAVIIAGVAGIAAATSSPAVQQSTRPVATTPAKPAPKAVASTPAPPPTTAAPSTPAAKPDSGPVGTVFTITSDDDNGNEVQYDVTLTKVDQHAQGSDEFETPSNPKDHFAAVRFTITGDKGNTSDDADSNATGVDSATDVLQASFNSVSDGGNFDSGSFQVSPGQSESGWVTFEVAPGKTLAQVKWAPDLFSGSAATWTL